MNCEGRQQTWCHVAGLIPSSVMKCKRITEVGLHNQSYHINKSGTLFMIHTVCICIVTCLRETSHIYVGSIDVKGCYCDIWRITCLSNVTELLLSVDRLLLIYVSVWYSGACSEPWTLLMSKSLSSYKSYVSALYIVHSVTFLVFGLHNVQCTYTYM